MTTKHEPTTDERIAEIRARIDTQKPTCDTADLAFLLAEVDKLSAERERLRDRFHAHVESTAAAMAQLAGDLRVAKRALVAAKSPAEQRADEIEAEIVKHGCARSFEDAIRFAREAREDALWPVDEARQAQGRLDAAAWLIVAGRMLVREASR